MTKVSWTCSNCGMWSSVPEDALETWNRGGHVLKCESCGHVSELYPQEPKNVGVTIIEYR